MINPFSGKPYQFKPTSERNPIMTDELTELERTGYAAQDLADTDIHQLSGRYMAFKRPYPVNADHTTLYHLYS